MSRAVASNVQALIEAAGTLREQVDRLRFAAPVSHVYNPLRYAWGAHEAYLRQLADARTQVVFLGMNPGPWGMAQTGVPFGEVAAVRDWMGIEVAVDRPKHEHPKRPVQGLACPRSEVSGRRLWGLFADRFGKPSRFFREHFVANYCPLVFMEASARNRTPDKLPADEKLALQEICDQHLRRVLEVLSPRFAVGIGAYAEACLARACEEVRSSAKLVRILHPSPASPAANRNWAATATAQLIKAGVWK